MIKKDKGSVLVVFFFTEKCNLSCKYCYVKQSQNTMTWDVAKHSVDFISKLGYEDKTLCFMGGEPLVEWKLVKNITAYAQGKGINKFNLCTNMILIDEKKINFFIKNNFNVMFSIDGIAEAQNAGRRSHNNEGSFSAVDQAIDRIYFKKDKIKFSIQMCLTPYNIKYLSESFAYLIEKGIANTKIYLIPIVFPPNLWKKENFGCFEKETKKLFAIYEKDKDELKKCRLIFGKCCSPYDVSDLKNTRHIKGELCLCKHRYYGIDVNGDIYYCFFSGFSQYKDLSKDYKLGNVYRGIVQREKFNAFTGKGMERCMSCLAWNYIVNKDVRIPAVVYKKMYSFWLSV